MRALLIYQFLTLIGGNWLFRHYTHPSNDAWFSLGLWLTFVVAAAISLRLHLEWLRRLPGVMVGMLGFVCAWSTFYFLWSGGTILISTLRYNRMLRLREDPFVLFADTSGIQFTEWDRDTNFYFLIGFAPACILAGLGSLLFLYWNRATRAGDRTRLNASPSHGQFESETVDNSN